VARDRDPARPGRDRAGPRRGPVAGGPGLPAMLEDGVEITYNNLSVARTTLLRRFVLGGVLTPAGRRGLQ